MAIVRAVKSGNWSDTTVWNTGALPTSADDVYSNTFTVTIDTSPTVLSISNATATGVTAGGSFVPSNGITLTCTGAGITAGSTVTPCFTSSLTSGQSCSLVANITGGSGNGSYGVSNSGAGTVNITGNCTGGSASTGPNGVNNGSTGAVNITGNCTGGAGTNSHGASNGGTGTLNITGNCTGASGTIGSSGANNNSTGTMTVIGSLSANGYPAIALGNIAQNTFLTGPFIGTAQGVPASVALRWRWIASVGSSYMTAVNSTATGYKNLFTADNSSSTSGQPAASNVRSGTVYGPANELTGTCAVPGASSVLSGVPVDNTTGTATVSAASIRSALGMASANLDTQLSNVPSSVWSATTRTITGGTVDTLTNSPDVPTEAEIASQVRTELTPELNRIANCATVATTGQQIQDALS